MASRLASAYVEIVTQDKTAAGLNAVRSKLSAFSGQMKSMLAFTATLVGAAGLAKITSELLSAAKGAASLRETLSKVGVVFGDQAGQITGLVDEMADKFGTVKKTALDAAANIGLILEKANMSKQGVTDLSMTMLKLAADTASFFEITMDEALTKIRSGLVGEMDPLKQIGVSILEGDIDARGKAKGMGPLGSSDKIGIRAELILEQLAKAIGDKARTIDSASNQIAKFEGDIENARVALGDKLIPSLTNLTDAARAAAANWKETFGTEFIDDFTAAINASTLALKMFGTNLGGTLADSAKVGALNMNPALKWMVDKVGGKDDSRMGGWNVFKRIGDEDRAARARLDASAEAAHRRPGGGAGGAGPDGLSIGGGGPGGMQGPFRPHVGGAFEMGAALDIGEGIQMGLIMAHQMTAPSQLPTAANITDQSGFARQTQLDILTPNVQQKQLDAMSKANELLGKVVTNTERLVATPSPDGW